MLEMYTMKKDVRTTLELFMLKSYYFCQALITASDDWESHSGEGVEEKTCRL